jgi:hypothetical protein
MTSTKWHTSMSLAEVEDDTQRIDWWLVLGRAACLLSALGMAWGGYWLGKHWRVW